MPSAQRTQCCGFLQSAPDERSGRKNYIRQSSHGYLLLKILLLLLQGCRRLYHTSDEDGSYRGVHIPYQVRLFQEALRVLPPQDSGHHAFAPEYEHLNYPDFYIPEIDLYIEYFGVNENKQKNLYKKGIFEQDTLHNFAFIWADQNGILDEIVVDLIEEYKRKSTS